MPESYFNYCKSILGFEYSYGLKKQYIEIKACRDIFVHNDGIVNKIYLGKVGEKARGQNGETLSVDLPYFESTIVCLKRIVGETYRGLKKK